MLRSLCILASIFAVLPIVTSRIATGPTWITLDDENVQPPWSQYNQTEHVYKDQLVDHFNMVDDRRYSQRYWTVDQFWSSPDGPVLFLLCGEYTCPGVMPARLYPLELAYQFKALVVVAEHRFYGKSYPTNSSTENLYLLNSRQALNDFARFQTWFQRTQINEAYKYDGTNKWFVIGGSYPGALSAWYRSKYPHLVVGSLASSAVVEAKLDFPEFDAQVETSAGPECAAALRNITHLIEARLPKIKTDFQCKADIDDGDFMFLIADTAVEGVQYGGRTKMCKQIVPTFRRLRSARRRARFGSRRGQSADELEDDLVQRFVNYTINVFYADGNSCDDYDRRSNFDLSEGNDGRSWMWQTCTEVGYWQTARPVDVSIRSQRIDRRYYMDMCHYIFGVTEYPRVDETNEYYGGWNISTSNTFFVNGIEDPWQHASVQKVPEGVNNHAITVNCTNCAHCVELYTPTDNDASVLKDTRKKVTAFVGALIRPSSDYEASS